MSFAQKRFAFRRRAQRGQGMTEYIIIVALIAIAAIGVYAAFGGVVRGQTAVVASELAGGAGTAGARATATAGATAAATRAATNKNLSNYEDGNAGGAGGGGGGQ
ncbi:MAG TPA: hypothetical protein VFR90_04070 [Methylibium sp.]|uniref:hypothetical protein n=1 Tax=Methylibium sp. TaxID=2067992 RepID=UPI002DB83E90|nr:hypothetical protein [Methylibium sp.]HEU4458276.1 hypothetical protein [Methylibium sp.]